VLKISPPLAKQAQTFQRAIDRCNAQAKPTHHGFRPLLLAENGAFLFSTDRIAALYYCA
jgi:hypothetical protein